MILSLPLRTVDDHDRFFPEGRSSSPVQILVLPSLLVYSARSAQAPTQRLHIRRGPAYPSDSSRGASSKAYIQPQSRLLARRNFDLRRWMGEGLSSLCRGCNRRKGRRRERRSWGSTRLAALAPELPAAHDTPHALLGHCSLDGKAAVWRLCRMS